MSDSFTMPTKTIAHATIAANGRIVIPADMRKKLGLLGGEKLTLRVENGALVLETFDVTMSRIHASMRQHIPEGVSLADELIAERRAAAQNE
jgi:AbrB family looped-hinge helix DNA binding protein